MATAQSPRERVAAMLNGESPDRIPASTWRHFYDQEMTVQGEIDSLIAFQQHHNWDYLKINLRAQYHCEDWGVAFKYTGDPYESPTLERTPIKKVGDWGNLDALNPARGILGEHLKVIQGLRRQLGPDLPMIMTLFTPLGIASRMILSEDLMKQHLLEDPKAVHAAMEAITETFSKYVPLCLEAGADGLFFATLGFGTYDRMTDKQYDEFVRPYDMTLLKEAQEGWFNMLHVCRGNNMLRKLADYPVHAFNWDAQDPTNPTLAQGLEIVDGVVVGGIPQEKIATMSPDQVKEVVRDAIEQTGGHRFMIGSGCTMSPQTPHENLMAITEALPRME